MAKGEVQKTRLILDKAATEVKKGAVQAKAADALLMKLKAVGKDSKDLKKELDEEDD